MTFTTEFINSKPLIYNDNRMIEYTPIIPSEQNIIINNICQMWEKLSKQIDYNDCTIDCYIHNNIAYVIEINSGGTWSTAGSALFCWKEIINLEQQVLRLLL